MTGYRLPLEWFGQYPVAVGKEFRVDALARVVAIDETLDGRGHVTLALRDVRVPLEELERWGERKEVA